MARRILLFGGQGQLGQEFGARSAEWNVALRAPSRADCDIADRLAVARAFDEARPDVAVNAAAYTNVDRAESDVDGAHRTNLTGAAVVAEACERHAVPLIHVSTDFVFDGRKAAPYLENDPVSPINVYGDSKAQGDDAVRRLASRHIIIRTAWLFSRYRTNFLIRMLQLARERELLRVVDDEIGSPTAAYDLGRAIVAAARRATTDGAPWGTYHFAGPDPASRYDFASLVIDLQAERTGHRPAVQRIKGVEYVSPARRPADSRLCSDLFKATFGVEATSWRAHCERIVAALASDAGRVGTQRP